MALGEARDLVEHHRRVTHLAHINVDNGADLFLGSAPLMIFSWPAASTSLIQSRISLLAMSFFL